MVGIQTFKTDSSALTVSPARKHAKTNESGGEQYCKARVRVKRPTTLVHGGVGKAQRPDSPLDASFWLRVANTNNNRRRANCFTAALAEGHERQNIDSVGENAKCQWRKYKRSIRISLY